MLYSNVQSLASVKLRVYKFICRQVYYNLEMGTLICIAASSMIQSVIKYLLGGKSIETY